MDVSIFIDFIKKLDIDSIVGVPDSTLKEITNYINNDQSDFKHISPANEGSAVALAAGLYLATRKPVCVYMQNSGLGNAYNPVASLLNKEVYGIPALLLIGWRGEPGEKDEPQHKFQGEITDKTLELLNIKYGIVSPGMSFNNLVNLFDRAKIELDKGNQFAILIKKSVFKSDNKMFSNNFHSIVREEAIKEILKNVGKNDILVSTTGKISRELYENSDFLPGGKDQTFLTVGSMGHASAIALGLALENKNKRVYCIDGDGSVFMHMGTLALIGKQNPNNLVHIVLNNDAHESVGGMPTCASKLDIYKIAEACAYRNVHCVRKFEEISEVLLGIRENQSLSFVEIKVNLESREDLGRPKEKAIDNKKSFMKYHGVRE